jgi:hypothetical protein
MKIYSYQVSVNNKVIWDYGGFYPDVKEVYKDMADNFRGLCMRIIEKAVGLLCPEEFDPDTPDLRPNFTEYKQIYNQVQYAVLGGSLSTPGTWTYHIFHPQRAFDLTVRVEQFTLRNTYK